ncbi:MAG: hypothetical protein WCB97_01255 [Thiobacillus sp.]
MRYALAGKWTAGTLAAVLLLAGCVTRAPVVDQHFGEAVNMAKAQQTVNPDASRDQDPVAGLDGQAANAVIDRYHKSYETPPQPVNVFTIGIGGGGTSSGTSGQ